MRDLITKKKLVEFGLLFSFGTPLFIGWLIPLIYGHAFRVFTIYISIPILLSTIFKPYLLVIPYKLWMKLGDTLGWINSHLVLSLIFIFILQPTGIIMKCFGHDPLRKKFNNKKSYRESKKDNIIDLEKIF